MNTRLRTLPCLLRKAWIAVMMLAGASSIAYGHAFLSTDPSAPAEEVAWKFQAAQQEAIAAEASNDTVQVARSVYDDFLKWPFIGMTAKVTVCFWNGSSQAQRAVIDADKTGWEGFANITFDYYSAADVVRKCDDPNSADIRISLDGMDDRLDYDPNRPKFGFWSFVGSQANFPISGIPGSRYKVTVNLPQIEDWITINDLGHISEYVGHELGHARGLLHEHQRAECADWFNIEAMAAELHWSIEATKQNVASFVQLGSAAGHPVYAGPYDVLSLMQYNFKPAWWRVKQGQVNPCLRTAIVQAPSPGDKATLVAAYGAIPPAVASTPPAAPAPAAAPGEPSVAPPAAPVVMAAPAPQRMAFNEAYARLGSAIHTERTRVALTSVATVDSAIAAAVPRDSPERMRIQLRHYRAATVAADKSKALKKAVDNLETIAAQMAKLKTGQ